ncbi:WD40 repeat-like protein [Testicularia cyperi]|uniref:WD40 repeat-like protein n=1 Tax=Testicularia cyperi TaxID=1882483 RepID=A0A317XT43_9BASI|nr:WD40 repeat-like protein [Testicularia cyperi]
MAPLCTSAEVNLLIYHYLKESGFLHASFSLRHESRLDDSPLSKEAIVEPGQLVRYLEKGLAYASAEAHIDDDGTEKACSAPFRLIGPPHVCDGKSRPTPPKAAPSRLTPEPDPFAKLKPTPGTREAAVQTPAVVNTVASKSTKTSNGTHASATTSVSTSRRVSSEADRSSAVASSSKTKLDDGDASQRGTASRSSAPLTSHVTTDKSLIASNKTKEAKRKASTSVATDKEREDKRIRRSDEAQSGATEAARINGGSREAASRSASPSVDRKLVGSEASRNGDKESSSGNGESKKKKKGGAKSSTSENGENGKKRDKDSGARGKDAKAPLPQPKGDNHIEDGQITALSGHTGEVFISAWNPTVPNMLASGGGDATVRIWEVPERAGEAIDAPPTICKHLPAAQSKDISTLDWNPDGTLLASGSYDGIVRLWTPQGDLHLVMSMHQGPVISVRWNRKGNMLLTGSADGTIIVWDLNSGKPRHTYPLHSDSVLDVEWLSTADGSLRGKSSSDTPPPMPHGLSWSVADQYFASCSADNSINLCKLGEPKPVKSFKGHSDEVNAIRFDPSQTLLASVSDDNTAKIWALEIGNSSAAAQSGPGGQADGSRKRASQRRGGSAHLDGMDIDEDPTSRSTEDGAAERDRDRATPSAASGTGTTAQSGGAANSAKDAGSTSSGVNGVSETSSTTVSNAAASGGAVVTTTAKGPNKGLRLTLAGHTKELYALAWCPTGPGSAQPDQPRMLATSSFDWTARLWNADTGECLRVIDGHADNVYTLRFSPCARYLATGGIDKRVIISRVDNGALVKQYLGGGAIFDLSWKDLAGSAVATKEEEDAEKDAAASQCVDGLPRRHQLAVSQADRKLIVLNLEDLASTPSTRTFKTPASTAAIPPRR